MAYPQQEEPEPVPERSNRKARGGKDMDSKNPVKICWDIVFQQSPLWSKLIAGLILISLYQMGIGFWDGIQGRRCEIDAWYNPPNSTTAVIGCFVRGLIDAAPRNYPEDKNN